MTVDESVPRDGYLVTDSRCIIQSANQTSANMFKLSQRALIGRHLPALLAPDEHVVFQSQLQKFEKGESELEWEMTLAPNGLASFSAFLNVSALRGPSGQIVAIHWLIRDVSVLKRLAVGEQLLQALGEHVLEGFSLSQSLSRLCDQLMQRFAYPLVWVAIREADGEISVCAQSGESRLNVDPSYYGLTDEERRCVESVLDTRETLHLQEEFDWTDGVPRPVEGRRYPAQLVVPLYTRDRAFGVLGVCGGHRDAFDPFTVQWFEKLARQMTITLLLVKDAEELRVRGAAIASAGHAVFIMDPDGLIEWVNDAYTRLTGHAAADLIGTIPQFLKSDKVRLAFQEARRSKARDQFWRHELVQRRQDGRSYTVEQVLAPLRNDRGEVTHFVAIHEDITVRKEAEARIFHLAHHDPLTDLPNRIIFYDRLKQALVQARRRGRGVGVLFVDLDRFKPINDSLGHETGDALLKIVADRLIRCVRRTDTIARLSGDEFTMVLQDLDQGQDAGHVAQKVLEAVGQPATVGNQTVLITASVGIALYPFDAADPDLLIAQADRAMYRAKKNGGHCYQFVSEEMNSRAFERLG